MGVGGTLRDLCDVSVYCLYLDTVHLLNLKCSGSKEETIRYGLNQKVTVIEVAILMWHWYTVARSCVLYKCTCIQ